MNQIKICHWNANGVSQHKLELTNFLHSKDIDIMLLSETHLTNKKHFHIDGFTFYRSDHPDGKAHGGTGILIRNRLKHTELSRISENYLQTTSISLHCWGSEITFCSVYFPPRFSISESEYTDFFNTLGNTFIAAGDYNAKHSFWGSRLTNPKGKQLYKTIINRQNKLDVISPIQPTHWPSDPRKIPDVIDFGVTKNLCRSQISSTTCLELSSDHSPVFIELKKTPLISQKQFHAVSKNTNWLKYKKFISSHIDDKISLKSPNDIEIAVQNLNSSMVSAAIHATPVQKHSHPNKVTSSAYIEHLVQQKRKCRRAWQRRRSPQAAEDMNAAKQKLREALAKELNNELENLTSSLHPNSTGNQSLWKHCKSIKPPITSEPPLRNSDGNWSRTDEEKSMVFANHLQTVFQPNPSQTNFDLATIPYQPRIRNFKFIYNDIKKELSDLNPKKACGEDLVSPKMFMELPWIAIKQLTHIFNAVLRLEYFPEVWKLSKIKMIAKPGKNPSAASSYRPISLLPISSKIFEKLLLRKFIQPEIVHKQILPDHQFGFREKHSTVEQVNRITNEVRKAFEDKKYCSAIFLDIAQAFDKVWHEGLIHKLKLILPSNIVKVLESYLTNRKFKVSQNEYLSIPFDIKAGVPQGSVLGPTLYLIFTADLPTHQSVMTSTFADDTAILSSNKCPAAASMNLNKHLRELESWLANWRIRVNENKSTHITFTLRRDTCPRVFLNNTAIPQADHVKYLGMHLDRRLTWRKHLDAKKLQMKLKFQEIHWLLNFKSKLSIEHKILLYKAIIMPIWQYGAQLWCSTSPSNTALIQRAQSKILRCIINPPWFIRNEAIHRDLQIPLVQHAINNLREKYLFKLSYHSNHLAKNLSNLNFHSRLKRNDFATF